MGKPGFPIPLRAGFALLNPPAGGGVGKPGFPMLLREGCALPNPPTGWGVGKPGFPMLLREGCALPNPPTGWGVRKPGFPMLLREGCALTCPEAGAWGNPVSPSPCSRAARSPARGRGCGETRFPHGHVRRLCVWRTPPDAHGSGARAGRPRHSAAGTLTAPSVTLPRWGREPGSSPQREEAGRGAERCERWSPQGYAGCHRRVPNRPLPDPPPLGAGTRLLPRQGEGRTLRTAHLLRA